MSYTFRKEINTFYDTDVAVIGGGVAGTAAAIAAARNGSKVMLIEQNGCLGGLATLGHVSPFDATKDRAGKSFGGIAQEILNNMDKAQQDYGVPDSPIKREGPHLLKWVMLKMAVESGVEVLFHAGLIDVEVENDTIQHIIISTKSGLRGVRAKNFIDATGDADLVYLTGEEFIIGSEESAEEGLKKAGFDRMHFEKDDAVAQVAPQTTVNCAVQPVSIMFTMGNVDISKQPAKFNNKLLKYEDLGITKEEFEKLPYAGTVGFEENGDLIPLPQGRILIGRTGRPGEMLVNMSRVIGVNATDADELTKAEITAQMQVMYIVDFLKRFVPGFENSFLVESGNTLGVRETRRLIGKYVLKGIDAIDCLHFDDDVACGSYMIDIHDPHGKRKAIGGDLLGTCYGIPYRSLLPKTVKNMLVCGRCISADHVAHASTRIQGTCCMTGQAAGTAAAMANSEEITPAKVSVEELRAKLLADGVYLG